MSEVINESTLNFKRIFPVCDSKSIILVLIDNSLRYNTGFFIKDTLFQIPPRLKLGSDASQ